MSGLQIQKKVKAGIENARRRTGGDSVILYRVKSGDVDPIAGVINNEVVTDISINAIRKNLNKQQIADYNLREGDFELAVDGYIKIDSSGQIVIDDIIYQIVGIVEAKPNGILLSTRVFCRE